MPKYDYNLIVIGGGSAGLVSSYIAATVRAKVAIIEKNKMGGDCLNTGCVPSKAIIRSAEILSTINNSEEFGITVPKAIIDFKKVMQRVQNVIKQIEPHDSIERYTKLGVECFTGEAEIISPNEVQINGKVLTTKSIILAIGAEPFVPDIEGLENCDYLTSDNIWNLKELPKKLVVLGGGTIGCELAQSFARLSSDVTIIERSKRLMKFEDEDASAHIHQSFKQDGVNIKTGYEAFKIEGNIVYIKNGIKEEKIEFDKLLIAVGRKPRTLPEYEELGIKTDAKGYIQVNKYLQTDVKNIYACGDIVAPYQFTHIASHEAWYACVNALLGKFKKFKADYSNVAWCTFTHPNIARLGLNEQEARQQKINFEVTKYDLEDLDRAITDGKNEGFVKILTVPKKDKILGVTIVGNNVDNLLTEFTLAKKHGLGVNGVFGTMHPYPTMSEANKYAAGIWKNNNKPEWALKLLKIIFRLMR